MARTATTTPATTTPATTTPATTTPATTTPRPAHECPTGACLPDPTYWHDGEAPWSCTCDVYAAGQDMGGVAAPRQPKCRG